MNSNKSKEEFNKLQKILIIIVAILFIGFAIRRFIIDENVKNSQCSTIGITIEFVSTGRGGKDVKYTYTVNKIKYSKVVKYENNEVRLNSKYLVKYLCDDPSESLIFFDQPR